MKSLLDFWHYYFAPLGDHWYDGAIWGNIWASILTAGAVFLWGRRKFIEMHRKIDRNHKEHMAALRKVK